MSFEYMSGANERGVEITAQIIAKSFSHCIVLSQR